MDKEKFNKIMGETIRDSRIEKELTQNEVAALIGMDAQNFSKYERGLISPTVFWTIKYCEAIKYDFGAFMNKLNRQI